uniref:TerC family protein n=1 Tax=Thaumasiovibrio occultus TaxID=1891184 RepID=UPI000B34AAFC|nr:TerC family protein [Thaumasiovibrio occultus]
MNLLSFEGFIAFTFIMLAFDFWLTRGKTVSIKQAIGWSLFWVALALLFNGVIWLYWDAISPDSHYTNGQAAMAFLTGYLLEKSLSVDNLFVFAMIFGQFAVPEAQRPRVLMLGIVGALICRGVMIAIGAELLATFHWMLYLFAAFLLYTGVKFWFETDDSHDANDNKLNRLFRGVFPVTETYQGDRFVVKNNGRWFVTPLMIVILVISLTDVMFALDSIPAIFAVTQEPFLVLAANVFALLGLRSLYFVLAHLLSAFCYLKYALSAMLIFISVKMVLMETAYAIPTSISLAVIVGVLTVAIVASWWKNRQDRPLVAPASVSLK